jgi:CrcB protein
VFTVLYVAVGSAAGGCLRYGVGLLVRYSAFPYATFLCNCIGSFLIGFVSSFVLHKFGTNEMLRPLLVTGFLGGFTTFSTFSLDTLKLLQSEQFLYAAVYVVTSVVLSLLLVFTGFKLGDVFREVL